jgi:hypothetical protein
VQQVEVGKRWREKQTSELRSPQSNSGGSMKQEAQLSEGGR